MPYGKEFLDTLDKILNDGGKTSNNIAGLCRKCGEKPTGNVDEIFAQDQFQTSNLCDGCLIAQLF